MQHPCNFGAAVRFASRAQLAGYLHAVVRLKRTAWQLRRVDKNCLHIASRTVARLKKLLQRRTINNMRTHVTTRCKCEYSTLLPHRLCSLGSFGCTVEVGGKGGSTVTKTLLSNLTGSSAIAHCGARRCGCYPKYAHA